MGAHDTKSDRLTSLLFVKLGAQDSHFSCSYQKEPLIPRGFGQPGVCHCIAVLTFVQGLWVYYNLNFSFKKQEKGECADSVDSQI